MLVAGRERNRLRNLELGGETDGDPGIAAARQALVGAVIEVDVHGGLVVGRDVQDGVVEVPETLVVALLFRTGVIGVEPGDLRSGPGRGETKGLAGVVIFDIVPAVDELNAGREGLGERLRYPQTGVVVRTIRIEVAAGVVPSEVGLGKFCTGGGKKFAEVDLQTASVFRFERHESLRNIVNNAGAGRLGSMEHVPGATEADVEGKADRIGVMRQRDLRHVQRKRVGFYVEVAQNVVAGSWIAKILAIVTVNQSSDLD